MEKRDAPVVKEIEAERLAWHNKTMPAADRVNALEARLNRIEAALSNCVQWGDLPKVLADCFKEAGVKTMAARLDKLEAQPPLEYRGVWQSGKTYPKNALVTQGGSLWIAKQTTAAYPGGGAEPGSWQLCCKRGADGRDGKDGREAPAAR